MRLAYVTLQGRGRTDALIAEVSDQGASVDDEMGETYLALHTLRCRSAACP